MVAQEGNHRLGMVGTMEVGNRLVPGAPGGIAGAIGPDDPDGAMVGVGGGTTATQGVAVAVAAVVIRDIATAPNQDRVATGRGRAIEGRIRDRRHTGVMGGGRGAGIGEADPLLAVRNGEYRIIVELPQR